MKKVTAPKGLKTAHTPNTQKGMGDFYGQGIKAPVGKMRSGIGLKSVSKAKLKKPPKALA